MGSFVLKFIDYCHLQYMQIDLHLSLSVPFSLFSFLSLEVFKNLDFSEWSNFDYDTLILCCLIW